MKNEVAILIKELIAKIRNMQKNQLTTNKTPIQIASDIKYLESVIEHIQEAFDI